jgi:putative aldouronate transport system substrate-binding protein
MFKKVLITVGLLLILLNACSTATITQAEPTVLSVLYNERKDTPYKPDWLIFTEYKKRQNVVFDVRLGDDAAYDKALSQTLDSGNIPDIILKVWPNTIQSYASSGLLLPFSDYENQMPNFMAYIKKHNLQAELDKLRLSDGKYYLLPGYQRKNQVQQWIYRRDVFEKNNLAMPKTYDELFDDLVILKGLYPESTPITASWSGAHLFAMMGAGYGIPAGWAGTSYYNKPANRWEYAPATQNYKELYTFLNRCYAAGILDPATLTQTPEEFIQKLEDGSALVTVTWITSGFNTWNEKLKANGFPDGEWAALPVMESTIGIKALPPVDAFRKGLAVPARVTNEPYFKDLLKFLDWAVYSEEGMTLTTWGVEGVTFENTSSGKAFLPQIKTPKNPDGTIITSAAYGFDMLFNLNENQEYEDYKKPAEIVKFLENSLSANETLELNPKLVLDSSSVEAIRLINEKIDPYVTETSVKFITGELNLESDWNAYLLELENRGYKTLEELWNDAWVKQNK